MPFFSWNAVDRQGILYKGLLFARSREDAQYRLTKEGMDDIFLQQTASRKSCREESTLFFRQLATMVRSGVRLHQALLAVQKSCADTFFCLILADIAELVERGMPLSSALAVHPQWFEELQVVLIRAGEETGSLAISLAAIAEHLEQRNFFVREVRKMLMVPFGTALFFMLILCGLLWFVVPRFEQFFLSFRRPIPFTTRLLFRLSDIFCSWWFLVLGLLAVVVIGFVMFRAVQQKKVQDQLLAWCCSLPGASSIVQEHARLWWLKVLGTLLAGGVRLAPALLYAAKAVSPQLLGREYKLIACEVMAGKKFSDAYLHHGKIFSSPLLALIVAGEESGLLAEMISDAVRMTSQEYARRRALLSSLVQPFCIFVLGGFVVLIMALLYVPLLSLHNVF